VEWTHVYVGRLRPDLRGRLCRIVATWRGKHAKRNVLAELASTDGQRIMTPIRCLRRIKAPAEGRST